MSDYRLPVWLRLPIPVFLTTNVIIRWTQTKMTNYNPNQDNKLWTHSDERLLVASLVATNTNSRFLDDQRKFPLDTNQDELWRL